MVQGWIRPQQDEGAAALKEKESGGGVFSGENGVLGLYRKEKRMNVSAGNDCSIICICSQILLKLHLAELLVITEG